MAAGIATLDQITADPDLYLKLEKKGQQLEEGLSLAAKKAGIPITINRIGSMMTLFFSKNPVTEYQSALKSNTKTYAKFFHGMLKRGNYFPPSQFETFFISTKHTKADITKTIRDASSVFNTLV